METIRLCRWLKNTGITVLILLLVIGCCAMIPQRAASEGSSSSVLKSKAAVENYLKNLYSSKKSVTIIAGTEKKLECNNHKQSDIKKYYNENNGSADDIPADCEGICWASAITSLLEFYGCEGEVNKIAYDVLTVAKSNKYWSTDNTGLGMMDTDDLVTKMFNSYDIDKKGSNTYINIYSTLKTEVNSGRVSIFKITNHIMAGCGYVPYSVKYEQTNIFNVVEKKLEKQNFVICNDTWANNDVRQYSYFPEREIGKNPISMWYFGLCMAKDK